MKSGLSYKFNVKKHSSMQEDSGRMSFGNLVFQWLESLKVIRIALLWEILHKDGGEQTVHYLDR